MFQSLAYMYFYTAAYKSVSASVPLRAITEVIQNAT